MDLQKKGDLPFQFAYESNGKFFPLALTQDQKIEYNAVENEQAGFWSSKILKLLNEQRIEKSNEFLTGEQKARAFIEKLGFYAARNTQVIPFRATDKENCDKIMGEGAYDRAYAVHYMPVGVIVPEHRSNILLAYSGSEGMAKLLVHELTHAASDNALYSYTSVYGKNDREWEKYVTRQGLTTTNDGATTESERGIFLAESLAAHAEGLYTRRQCDDTAPLNSISGYPEPHKPAFYDMLIPPINDGTLAAGHDAYAIEMISWKAHEIGVTDTPHRLIEAFYATALSDPKLQLEGLRAIPRIINSVQPKLYDELRNVPLEKQAFIDAMDYVYDIVSK